MSKKQNKVKSKKLVVTINIASEHQTSGGSRRMNMSSKGKWVYEQGKVTFIQEGTPDQVYDHASLLTAVNNVKKSRDAYGSQAAYDDDLHHFECGLSLIDFCVNDIRKESMEKTEYWEVQGRMYLDNTNTTWMAFDICKSLESAEATVKELKVKNLGNGVEFRIKHVISTSEII
jgi:hypothetical protein